MESELNAVILAAGVGSRMGDLTRFKPKSMIELNGKTLIEYQLEQLKEFGIDERKVFVIGGHRFAELKAFVASQYADVNLVFNSKFKEWNNIYTFYLIKELTPITGNFLLINSDTIFDRRIIENLTRVFTDNSNYLVTDVQKKLTPEDMKVLTRNGRVTRIDKDLPVEEGNGEYIGLAKFNISEIGYLFESIGELLKTGRTNLWYEDAINRVLDRVHVKYVPTDGFPWVEIDTIEDYRRASSMGIV